MIRRSAAGLVLVVLLAALCVPAVGQWWPSEYIAVQIDMSVLQDAYLSMPLPDTYTDGEPPCADDYSAWYTFTLTEATQVGIYAAGYAEGDPWWPDSDSRVEVQAALYRDDGGLVEVRCGTGGSALDVQFIELLSAGKYYVQVGTAALPSSYRLVIAPSPVNDEISGAQQLTLPTLYSKYHAAAASSGDGEYTCADQHSLWFRFTLDTSQKVNFFASAPGFGGPGLTPAKMGLYKDGGTLSLIKCTGDGVGEQSFYESVAFTKRLEAGTYYLQVGTTGKMPYYHLVLINGAPANDDMADAKLLTFPFGDMWDWTATSEGVFITIATMEKGVEPAANPACPSTLYHSIWYKFELNERRAITISKGTFGDIAGPTFPNDIPRPFQYMDVWHNTSSGLQAAACSSKGNIEKILDAGTYYLRIASPIKVHKHFPSDFRVSGKSEPVGMPTIIDQPDSNLYLVGETGQATVVVASDTPLTYQWYRGTTGDTSQPIAGATGSSYSIMLTHASTWWAWVRVTNAVGYRDSRSVYFSVEPAVTRTELLANGDFENGGSGWNLKNGSGDKVRCGGLGYQSACAFVFKGGLSEKAVLKQVVNLAPIDAPWGFSFNLRLRMKTAGHDAKLMAVIRVTYGGVYRESFKVHSPAADDYILVTESTLPHGFGEADSVTLTIKHKAPTGKTYIDKLELLQVSRQSTTRGRGILPPPDAPEGFRGTN
jgi:hypothetical protein